ncbi:MAG: DUF1684 domain-containing protein [Bacteroidota bacterium]
MKKLIYILGPIILIIFLYTFIRTSGDDDYIAQVETERAERIKYLKVSESSPFQQYDQEFKEPNYYSISSDYRVNAQLERLSGNERVTIQNSDGSEVQYVKFAYANFGLKGQQFRLLILKPINMGPVAQYFTGFADNTCGNDTYGGGRYLDLEIGKSDHIVIDFNLAYNPYCAYVDQYQCPFPPRENILPVRIEAGEMDYHK